MTMRSLIARGMIRRWSEASDASASLTHCNMIWTRFNSGLIVGFTASEDHRLRLWLGSRSCWYLLNGLGLFETPIASDQR